MKTDAVSLRGEESVSWDDELTHLESYVAALLQRLERLELENDALRSRLEDLGEQRALLLARNDEARRRVESLIRRLRAFEHGS